MKNILILILSFYGTFLFAQNPVLGKVYRTKISESCSRTTTGGFMTYSYSQFEFTKDSVTIKYFSKNSDSPSEDVLIIKNIYFIKNGYIMIQKGNNKNPVYTELKITPAALLAKSPYEPDTMIWLIENPAIKPKGY